MGDIYKFASILLKLPDGRIILQRRTKNASYAPGKLNIFGGGVENDETTDECMVREIKEETSLDIGSLSLRPVANFVIPSCEDFYEDRHFYLYEALVANLDFEVYEGDGAEAYTLNEIKNRDDLSGSAKFTFSEIL